MSHELNNPLSILIGNALILQNEAESVARTLAERAQRIQPRPNAAAASCAASWRLSKRSYDVVISDVRLPGIDGAALYTWMAQNKPELCARTAFVTGDTLGQASERFLADAQRPLLEKPFLPTDVRRLIEELLHSNSG